MVQGRRLVLAVPRHCGRKMELECISVNESAEHTKGGLRYSIPILRALFDVFNTSFTRLYLSTLKLSVGPEDSLTILSEGAIGVSVNASK